MLASRHIRAARDSADLGVTVCYNTVKDVKYVIPVLAETCMGINPVNWRTDATPANLVTEPSPFIPLNQQKKDNLTVTLDTVSNLLLVDGFSATDYVLPLIGKEGNYHSRGHCDG